MLELSDRPCTVNRATRAQRHKQCGLSKIYNTFYWWHFYHLRLGFTTNCGPALDIPSQINNIEYNLSGRAYRFQQCTSTNSGLRNWMPILFPEWDAPSGRNRHYANTAHWNNGYTHKHFTIEDLCIFNICKKTWSPSLYDGRIDKYYS